MTCRPMGFTLLISLHVQTENFPRLAFRNHLEWPAADFAISNEGLGTDAGIDRQLKALAAKGALDGFRYLHANPRCPFSG